MYNKDNSLSGILLLEQILLFLLGQRQERLRVSRRELYRWSRVRWGYIGVWCDPTPLHTSHPYCPETAQRPLSKSSGQCFVQSHQATEAAEGLNLAKAANSDQSDQSEHLENGNGCLLKWLFPKCTKSRKGLDCCWSFVTMYDCRGT